VTDQQRPARSDDAAAAADSGNRAALWSGFFRVAEIRARSTPQLVAISGIIVTVAVTFPWMTITHINQGGTADWFWVVLLLIADLTVLVCLPGLGVAIAELVRRAWRLVTLDDGAPLLPRLARAAAKFTAEGRRHMGRWLDRVRAIVVFSILVTPVLAAAVGIFVAYEAIRDDRPVGLWVLGPVVTVIALCVLPISVPAAAGSFARRVRRKTGR
jgi:hypothetical protein